MTHPVVLVIPTRGNRNHQVAPLLDLGVPTVLVHTVIVMPSSTPVEYDMANVRYVPVSQHPVNISRWWNAGLDAAMELGASSCVVMNDDVQCVDPAAVTLLGSMAVRGLSYVYPRSTPGWTPMTGWCFGINPDLIRPDEDYQFWCGEDDMFQRASAQGLPAVGVDLRRSSSPDAIQHTRDSHYTDDELHGELALQRLIDVDVALYASRWGQPDESFHTKDDVHVRWETPPQRIRPVS